MTENTDVVVIGGGYAGVLAANRLTQRDDVTVTLNRPGFHAGFLLAAAPGGEPVW